MFIFVSLFGALFGSALCACDSGWDEYNNSCYYFSRVKNTHFMAQTFCRNLDASLVEVDNAQEQDFLADRIKIHMGPPYLIGLTDLAKEGHYKWESSHASSGFSDWHTGQPDGQRQENCVVMGLGGHWHDTECFHTTHFICEKEQPQLQLTVVG